MNISKIIKSVFVLMIALGLTANAQAQYDNMNKKDIVDLAVETEALSTLVTAVKAAGLVETLKSEGPFTVFAPTDAAFEALAEDLGYSISELLTGQFIDNIVKTHLLLIVTSFISITTFHWRKINFSIFPICLFSGFSF